MQPGKAVVVVGSSVVVVPVVVVSVVVVSVVVVAVVVVAVVVDEGGGEPVVFGTQQKFVSHIRDASVRPPHCSSQF